LAETVRRVTYTPTEAARMLRVSPTRVRQLLQDGELHGERDEAGHWLIPARVVHERVERLRRETFLEAVVHDPSIVDAMQERVEVLRAQVEMLRAELKEAHAANQENRRIIAALAQRVPELKAPRDRASPQEPPGGPEGTADEQQGRGPVLVTGPPRTAAEPPEERRLWWRRFFGFE
jgi:excisionase family DNA binding protein